jgi:hypothetical protein
MPHTVLQRPLQAFQGKLGENRRQRSSHFEKGCEAGINLVVCDISAGELQAVSDSRLEAWQLQC